MLRIETGMKKYFKKEIEINPNTIDDCHNDEIKCWLGEEKCKVNKKNKIQLL